MNDFLLVVAIASFAAFLTYLGAPLAERFIVPHTVTSAALQFAAGVIVSLVAFSLMPQAVRGGLTSGAAIAFFVGGAAYVMMEYYFARRAQTQTADAAAAVSMGLYVSVLADLIIDGAVIGIGAALTLTTGLLLAMGMAISTLPLAFVTITTAREEGISKEHRRLLSFLFFACILVSAILGFVLLRNQSSALQLTLISFASGFLLTAVTQGMIPQANRDGEPSFAGIFFVAGLTLYGVISLVLK